MKTIYFVRHGESPINVKSTHFMGEDSGLTEKGWEQAKVIAERCSKLPIQKFVASPMVRTKLTAEVIAEKVPLPIQYSDEFIERVFPDQVIGKPVDDEETVAFLKAWQQSFFVDSENFRTLAGRADRALRFLEEQEEEHILVVTHGYFMRSMFARVLFGAQVSPSEYEKVITRIPKTENTHISVFQYDTPDSPGNWKIWVWNDHAHLG
jgi:broad specificity phosphatase PhoE